MNSRERYEREGKERREVSMGKEKERERVSFTCTGLLPKSLKHNNWCCVTQKPGARYDPYIAIG